MTEGRTIVTKEFNLAQGYYPSDQFDDTSLGTDRYMFVDALVLLIKVKEYSMSPQCTRLAITQVNSLMIHH